METEIIRIAATQGLWAVLFVCLLFWVLRENAKREAEYRQFVQDLTQKLSMLEIIGRDIGEIKTTTKKTEGCIHWIKNRLLGGERVGS